MNLRRPDLKACDTCGGKYVEYAADGLTLTFRCVACESFVAELVEGAEP